MLNENTFIISDTHFGHSKIAEFEPMRLELALRAGFDDINSYMLNLWNTTITDNDNVLILGDFAFKENEYWTKSLKGNKYLIMGNHDHKNKDSYVNWGFKDVFDNIAIHTNSITLRGPGKKGLSRCYIREVNNIKIMFSHFPIEDDCVEDARYLEEKLELKELFDNFKCDINIHGHTHSRNATGKNCINVSAEVLNLIPTRLKEII